MDELTELPNIGPVLANKLEGIGIMNLDELSRVGSVKATVRIGAADISACYNMLYALEGAIRGIRWHDIPSEDRQMIKEEFNKTISS